MAGWDMTALLLRQIDLGIRAGNWQRSGGKGSKPKPIELPDGKKAKKKPDGAAIAQRLRNLGLIPVEDSKT